MQSTIRNIGNSKGVILPQSLLKQCFIENEINIEVKDNTIVISPVSEQKRKGWADAFKEMSLNGDDHLTSPEVMEDEDFKEWSWK